MAIDIDSETIIGLFEVGKYCPGPRKPSRATVFRWWLHGLRVQGSNDRVKLETVKLSGIRCTSREAVGRFFRAVNAQNVVPTFTPTQRRKQAEIADRLCAAKNF